MITCSHIRLILMRAAAIIAFISIQSLSTEALELEAGKVLAVGNQGIELADPSNGSREVVFPMSVAQDMALDDTGMLFVTKSFGDKIIKIDLAQETTTAVVSQSNPGLLQDATDLVFDPSSRDLFVTNFGAGSSGRIVRLNLSTGAQTSVADNLQALREIQIDPNGKLVVSVQTPPSLVRVDPDTGEKETITMDNLLNVPTGLRFDADGSIVVTNSDNQQSRLVHVDPTSGVQTLISGGLPLKQPTDVDFEASGSLLVANFVGGFPGGSLIRVNPDTGSQTEVVSGMGFLLGLIVIESPPALEDIAASVAQLVQNGSLSGGQGNSLLSKLHNAASSSPNATTNQLEAFVNQVEAFSRAGQLTTDEADELIDAVRVYLDILS